MRRLALEVPLNPGDCRKIVREIALGNGCPRSSLGITPRGPLLKGPESGLNESI